MDEYAEVGGWHGDSGIFGEGVEAPGHSVFGNLVDDEVIEAQLGAAEQLMRRSDPFNAVKVSRAWQSVWAEELLDAQVGALSDAQLGALDDPPPSTEGSLFFDVRSENATDAVARAALENLNPTHVADVLISRLGADTARRLLDEWTPEIMVRQIPRIAYDSQEYAKVFQVFDALCERLNARVLADPQADIGHAIREAEDKLVGDIGERIAAVVVATDPLGSLGHDTLGYASPEAHAKEIESIFASSDEHPNVIRERRRGWQLGEDELEELRRVRLGEPPSDARFGADDWPASSAYKPKAEERASNPAGHLPVYLREVRRAMRDFAGEVTYLTLDLARAAADRFFGVRDDE